MSNILELIKPYESSMGDNENILKGNLLPEEQRVYASTDSNAFLIGLISDQSVKAETAWSLPYKLSQRLKTNDLGKIAEFFTIEEVQDAIRTKPALHRYPTNIGRYIWLASEQLIKQYDGKAHNIWKDSTAIEIVSRLEAFKGISHKKAALACLLLVRDLNYFVPDKENIDIVYDIHIRRIFLRAGFCETDTYKSITEAARKLYPEFPGFLTSSFWAIGRELCRPTDPKCEMCPLQSICKYYTENKND